MQITVADFPSDLPTIRSLFDEYVSSLSVDLGFQSWDSEMAGLPGKYAPPRGGLWLARSADRAAGCVALRPLDAERSEMKRLYVRPEFRGYRLGRLLAQRAIDGAVLAGYRSIYLDTLTTMESAVALYRSLGFREVEPYYPTPLAGTLFFARELV